MQWARFAAEFLVHDGREVYIKYDIVVDGQTKYNTHQGKLSITLETVGVKPEGLSFTIETKHRWNQERSEELRTQV